MQQPGHNPSRRNRNIGTAKSGHGQDNRLVIPWAWADRRDFYERLVNPVMVGVKVRSVRLHVLVEPPLPGFAHACTIDDIVQVLQLMPVRDFGQIQRIVLRQPKRKERILSPCWGRLVYWTGLGDYDGPTIYLESQDLNSLMKWDKSLKPDRAAELDRLRRDGHSVVTTKRQHEIHSTLETVRNTQLYRTLPHEVGHYVDYLDKVEDPSRDNVDKCMTLDQKYHSRPEVEKEAFAHRYADEFRATQVDRGQLPFDRIVNEAKMIRQGLRPEWFDPSYAV